MIICFYNLEAESMNSGGRLSRFESDLSTTGRLCGIRQVMQPLWASIVSAVKRG